jgi:glycosyltransferase involved in cell wall biosynthesis
MVLLEAMAVGLPLASFDCKCGPRDVIEDGKNGYLIPDGDLQLMEERICSLLNDKEKLKEMSRYSKETAERFSHENIMKRWIELFQSVKK